MKIRIIIPFRTNVYTEQQLQDARPLAAPDLAIDVVNLEPDPADPLCVFEQGLDEHLIVEKAVQAERDGCDAVFISCFGDPAVDAARGRLQIPVVGGFQPAALTASLVANGWSIVTLRKELFAAIRQLARKLGIESNIASLRGLEMVSVDYGNQKFIEAQLQEQAEQAIDKDGAEAIVLGCTGFCGFARELAQRLAANGRSVPVVEPVAAGIGYLQLLVRSGISHSRTTYGLFGETFRAEANPACAKSA